MYYWWEVYSNPGSDELQISVAYLHGELVGIAPFYKEKSSYFSGILPVVRIQPIGTRYRSDGGIRSEYMDLIVREDLKSIVSEGLVDELMAGILWGELVFPDIITGAVAISMIQECAQENDFYIRSISSSKSYFVDTKNSFDTYIKGLGKNTRLKLFNRRKELEKMGDVELITGEISENGELVTALNRFHRIRFERDILDSKKVKHLRFVISDLENHGVRQNSSVLKLNGEIVSSIVNISTSSKSYNIQLGYIENLSNKVSLGTLHLGYAIEEAFSNPDILSFDLLAGEGKNSDYKKRLAELESTLESIMVIRNPVLKIAYRFNDWLKELSEKKAVAKTA
jgi:hypothetical protein